MRTFDRFGKDDRSPVPLYLGWERDVIVKQSCSFNSFESAEERSVAPTERSRIVSIDR
jgi:hypothetical protein